MTTITPEITAKQVDRVTQSYGRRSASSSSVRGAVAHEAKTYWASVLDQTDTVSDAVREMQVFLRDRATSATTIAERINFIEMLDILEREFDLL